MAKKQIYRKLIYWLLTDSKQFRVDCVKSEYMFSVVKKKCFQKVDEVIQLARFN